MSFQEITMLWKLNNKGEPEMLTSKLMKTSTFGPVFVYDVGGQMLMVTSEMVMMGITRDKFLKQEMPKIRKAMGIEEPHQKMALRKAKKKEELEEKTKDLFKLIQPTVENNG